MELRCFEWVILSLLLAIRLSTGHLSVFTFPSDCYSGKSVEIPVGSPSWRFNSSGILKASSSLKYGTNLNCHVVLSPKDYRTGITVSVRKTDLRRSCKDNITISAPTVSRVDVWCGRIISSKEIRSFSALGKVNVTFRTSEEGSTLGYHGFELVFTSYTLQPCHGPDLFDCDNSHCISKNLKCDGHNHCGDRSDQKHCGLSSAGKVIGIVLACVFIGVAIISCIVCCVRRRKPGTTTSNIRFAQQPTYVYMPPRQEQVPVSSESPYYQAVPNYVSGGAAQTAPPYYQAVPNYVSGGAAQTAPPYYHSVPNYDVDVQKATAEYQIFPNYTSTTSGYKNNGFR